MGFHASRALRGVLIVPGCLALLAALACQTRTGPALAQPSAERAVAGGNASAPGRPAVGGPAPDGTGAPPGAAAGALADGALGRYLDDQGARLRDAVPDAEVRRQEDRILVTLSGDVIFDPGSATLRPGGYERLHSLAETLHGFPDTDIVIQGYTDSQGSEAFNLELSEERADRVRQYLMTQGIAERRLKSVGFGPQFPVASNDTPEGRQQNRRVVFELRPNQSLRDRAAAGMTR